MRICQIVKLDIWLKKCKLIPPLSAIVLFEGRFSSLVIFGIFTCCNLLF